MVTGLGKSAHNEMEKPIGRKKKHWLQGKLEVGTLSSLIEIGRGLLLPPVGLLFFISLPVTEDASRLPDSHSGQLLRCVQDRMVPGEAIGVGRVPLTPEAWVLSLCILSFSEAGGHS